MQNHKFVFRLGHKAFSEKNFEEAINQLTQAIEMVKDKPNPMYYAKRGESYLMTEQFDKCIKDCKLANIKGAAIESYKGAKVH